MLFFTSRLCLELFPSLGELLLNNPVTYTFSVSISFELTKQHPLNQLRMHFLGVNSWRLFGVKNPVLRHGYASPLSSLSVARLIVVVQIYELIVYLNTVSLSIFWSSTIRMNLKLNLWEEIYGAFFERKSSAVPCQYVTR